MALQGSVSVYTAGNRTQLSCLPVNTVFDRGQFDNSSKVIYSDFDQDFGDHEDTADGDRRGVKHESN